MLVTLEQKSLAAALRAVNEAVSPKQVLPILGTTRFVVRDGKTVLEATNLEIGVAYALESASLTGDEMPETAGVCIPAAVLDEFVRALPAGNVTIAGEMAQAPKYAKAKPKRKAKKGDEGESEPSESEETGAEEDAENSPFKTVTATYTNKVVVSCGKAKATLRTMDGAEFPSLPSAAALAGSVQFSVSADTLARIIRYVAFAAATDQNRPVFTAMSMLVNDGVLEVCAADSFRLAIYETPATPLGETRNMPQQLVPATALKSLAKLLPTTGDVIITTSPGGNHISFTCGPISFTSLVLAGQYPNYRAVTPRTFGKTAMVHMHEIRGAVRRASVFARDNSGNISRYTFGVHADDEGNTEGFCDVTAVSDEIGDAEGEFDATVEGFEPDDARITIILNSKYTSEALAAMETSDIFWGMNEPFQPIVLKPIGALGGNEADRYTYIAMPMHPTR